MGPKRRSSNHVRRCGGLAFALLLTWALAGAAAQTATRADTSFPADPASDVPAMSRSRPAVVARHGQSDRSLVDALPDLDPQALIAAETSEELPVIRFEQTGRTHFAPATEHSVAAEGLLGDQALPDTLLLYSGDWLGQPLRQAAAGMGLPLSGEQLETLEAVAVSRGINTRLLLVLALLKDAPVAFPTDDAWLKWLYIESARVRASLGPFEDGEAQTIMFRDGMVAGLEPALIDAPRRALATSLSAGQTAPELRLAMARFTQTYHRFFGDPTLDEAQPSAVAPFLYRPYTGTLTGRGYYDHRYPSVDSGRLPNVPGMLDYLGRTNTNYDTHDADDLWMPYGSEVIAPTSGTIIWIDAVGPDYGLLLRPAGTTYDLIIVHLSALLVGPNQIVTTGQPLGRSGSARIDHIHFEARHNGKQTDTMGWYGSGSDPCPLGPAAGGGYAGCEPSVWLWADQSPPSGRLPAPTATPVPCAAAPTMATSTRSAADLSLTEAATPAALPLTKRLLLPVVHNVRPCN